MRRNRTHPASPWWLAACAFALLPTLAPAQQPPSPGSQLPNPRILTLVPCGGKVGSTVEVTFTGTDLDQPEDLLFSHPGITAEPMGTPTTPKPQQPAQPQRGRRRGQMAANLVVSKFKVHIPPDVPPGLHDVRLVNKWGVSNPRAFAIGDLAEVLEKEPNNDVPEAQRVALNSTVNGAVNAPTDVDYYVFAGRKGQRVVVSCLASSIDSRMNAGLELYDATGRRLAENRNYHGTDALVDCTLPADGDYLVRVFEFTHQQGDPEHFYRLSITTAPWIDAIHPPMVEPGKPTAVTVYGRNLPGGKLDPTTKVDGRVLEALTVTVEAPKDPAALHRLAYLGHLPPVASALDGFEFRLRNPSGVSNPFLLTYAHAPVVLDNGKNDTPETAQEVAVPCEIAGRVEKRRDRDWYAFTAKKGQVFNIEVFSDRLGAPTDMALHLTHLPSKGVYGDGDDNPESLSPLKFFTPTSDPQRVRFAVPADGKYHLLVRSQDADLRAGPRHYYRVSITPEQPDFRVIVMPAAENRPDSCRLLRGGSQHYTVFVWRLGGFTGSVALTAEGLPAGVTCPPQVIGPDQPQAALVLSATPAAALGVHPITIKGTARINGQAVVREARPASVTWPLSQPQLVMPTISRLDRNLLLAVSDQAPFQLTATLDKPTLTQGEKGNITLKLSRLWPDFKTPLQVTLLDPPHPRNQPNQALLAVGAVTMAPGKDEAKAVLDVRPNLAPGQYNLVFRGVSPIPYNKDPMAKQKQPTNVELPSTPLLVTVLPKQLATVRLSAPALTAKAGAQGEVVVQVARQFDYASEFKVQLVLPPNVKGVQAAEAVIPAGKDDVKLVLKVAADAPPATYQGLIVRATGLYDGKSPITQEAKLNVTVVKK